jgi:hypothetical protein
MVIEKGEFKDSPMVTIKSDAADRWPFSFGPAKAAKLLEAISEHGLEKVMELLVEVAGDKCDDNTVEKVRQAYQ